MSNNQNSASNYTSDEADLDAFLDKIKYEYKDGWTEENWEEEMEKHPFFMTKPIDENATELPPAIEAIRQIKWDEDDPPRDKAIKYKEEGNLMFKAKKYKAALRSYHEGLKQEFEDNELHSILHSNCAASEYHLKNNRTAFKSCILARKYNPNNIKAIVKGAECCLELKLFDEGIKWCDAGLLINQNEKYLIQLRSKLESTKKVHDRDQRKKDAVRRKQDEHQKKILDLIEKKGIKCQEGDESFDLFDKSCNPQEKIVTLADDETSLIWPVIFLYPEYGQTDFIEAFNENSTFDDHLNLMFAENPPWDTAKRYNLKSLRIYYENRKKGKLIRLKRSSTLLEALKSEGYIIQVGTPSFVVMVADSPFEKIYLEKFSAI